MHLPDVDLTGVSSAVVRHRDGSCASGIVAPSVTINNQPLTIVPATTAALPVLVLVLDAEARSFVSAEVLR